MAMNDPFAGIGFGGKAEKQSQDLQMEQENPFDGVGFGAADDSPFAGLGLGGQDIKVDAVPSTTPVGSTAERNGEEAAPEGAPSSFLDRVSQIPSKIAQIPAGIGKEFNAIGRDFTDILTKHGTPQSTDLRAPILTETLPGAALGIGTFLAVKPVLFSATAWMSVFENLGLQSKTTGKEKKAIRDRIESEFATFGGKFEPMTSTGEFGLKALEVAISPIIKFVDSRLSSLGMDEKFKEKYPNIADAAQYGGEIVAFAMVPKIKERIKKINSTKTQAGLDKKLELLLKDAEAAAKTLELQKMSKEKFSGELYSPERQALIKNKYDIEKAEITNSSLGVKEKKKALGKLNEKYNQQQKEMAMAKVAYDKFKQRDPVAEAAQGDLNTLEQLRGQVGQDRVRQQRGINQNKADFDRRFNAEDGPSTFGITPPEPVIPTKSEMSQSGRGFEGEAVVRPDLRGEPPYSISDKIKAERAAREEARTNQLREDVIVDNSQVPRGTRLVGEKPIVPEVTQAPVGGERVVRPDLRGEPISRAEPLKPVEPAPKAQVEFLTDEGIPKTTYQIGENGKIKEVDRIDAKKTYQVEPESGKVELVENVPGHKKVWQILMKPIASSKEGGFIDLSFLNSRKKLLANTTPAFRENIRRFGQLAEKSGKPMIEFLKDNDFSKQEIKQMMKVAEAVKLESPFKAPKTNVIIPEGKDPLVLQPGEVNVNTGKGANPKTAIGDKFFEGIKNIKEVKLPPILQAITPTIHFIKDLKSPELLDLWHKTKATEGNRLKDVKILKNTVGDLRSQYPKRKLREEAFVKMMSQDKLGREALVLLDIKPIDGPIKYEGLVGELNGQFKDLFNQLNAMRSSIGKDKIAERKSYLPMIAQENFYSQVRQLFQGQEGAINHPNMVLDSVQAINNRHSPQAVEATALRHLKRRGLRKGVKLETDPLRLLAQYGMTAYKHIHYSPFNMFINQLTTGTFKTKNSKGEIYDWRMATQKPELHEFLSRWSNALAGKPNVTYGPALRFLETGAQKLSSNLTAAVLGWSARTVLVQPAAALLTAAEFGVTPTAKGLMRTTMRSKKDPINLSQELPNRIADASMTRDVTNQLKNPAMRAVSLPAEHALSAMKFVDYVVAEATWRTAFESSKHLGEKAAARLADEAVVRTQGSGFVGDLSPIQMNALGKAVTLWQTFTINNMNWLGREVLNIKHPERNPAETARRVATYTIGSALITYLFEEELGIQSPQPAPIRAMILSAQNGDSNFAVAYQGLKEITELAPFLSSLKFGSSPAGAVAEFLKELSEAAADDLPRALNGDKEAMKRVGFVAAKLRGVPGTQQVKRISQGTPLGFPVEKLGDSSAMGKSTRVTSTSPRVKTTRVKRTRRQK